MRKPYLLATLAASIASIVLVSMYATAQGPIRQPARPAYGAPPVAMVDVMYIFKNYPRFEAKMKQLKDDVERREHLVKQQGSDITRLYKELQQLNVGTLDYKKLEENIAGRSAQLSVRVKLQKKEILQWEAKILHDTYQEVLYEVGHYAKANGIGMVVRFNGEPVDVAIPQSMLGYINKPVVWFAQDRGIDITKIVLDRLIARSGGPPGNPPNTNRLGNAPPTRHGVGSNYPRTR